MTQGKEQHTGRQADFLAIQKKWQEKWADSGIFRTSPDTQKPKFYCLEMFPYPSNKLHMGHLRNYSIGDAIARYKRMRGFNVLYPMGYDAFGLPAENAAIKHKTNPKEWTYSNINAIRSQQKRMGLSYDWDREVITCDPKYYKWNQWLFLKMYEKGLAYKKEALVNWCKNCNTVLANEQVVQGKCWRCSTEVEQKMLSQWFFKITDYAEELLSDIDELKHWPKKVRTMQKNWIGKSYGVEIKFKILDSDKTISTFTTRPDTVYGITYLVLAAEHPLVMELVKGTDKEEEVKKFVEETRKRSILDRTDETKEKNGVFLGKYFTNPFTGDKCPLYVADYALMEYGTGAVMAVPAHDQRDFEFAKKYGLPIKVVINPPDGYELNPEKMSRAYVDDGIMTNSGEFDGMPNREALEAISDMIEKKGLGKRTVNYKLRDWLISRQRYWGTPIPVIYCDNCGIVPVPEEELPVMLPEDVTFDAGGNPLETSRSFLDTACPKCNAPARRETDTMDTFVDSSWYFLRYASPKEEKRMFNEEADYWMPVDQYIGGIEHAVLHLMYARFIQKVLRDLGLTKYGEPFERLLTQGMVIKDGAKMSKSLGNVVDPDEIINKYGSDTARLFILFAALPEKELDWSDQGVNGSYRFLQRFYSLLDNEFADGDLPDNLSMKERFLLSKTNRAVKHVAELIDKYRFSTAITELMELSNSLSKNITVLRPNVRKYVVERLVLMLSPFTPHICEEMWKELGKEGFVSSASWPKADEELISSEAEAAEQLLQQTRSDILTLKKLVKLDKISKATIVTADDWKRGFIKAFKKLSEKTRNASGIIKELMSDSKLRKHGKEIASLVPKLLKDPSKVPLVVMSQSEEKAVLEEAEEELSDEAGCKVEIISEGNSQHGKAKQAMPGKPAIILE